MSEWDRNYHVQKNPKVKATLITVAVTIGTFVGLVIAERIAYSTTFPASSETVEIDGNLFHVEFDDYVYITHILLITDTNGNETFPDGINATQIWFIPTMGRIWSWREYAIYPLRCDDDSSSANRLFLDIRGYGYSKGYTTYATDIIVEINASGRLFYVHQEARFPGNQ